MESYSLTRCPLPPNCLTRSLAQAIIRIESRPRYTTSLDGARNGAPAGRLGHYRSTLGGVGQSRADYLSPSPIRNLDGAGPFVYPPDAVPPSGSVLIAEALNQHIQVFVSTGFFVTRFSHLSSGYEQIFEPDAVAKASLFDPLTWQSWTNGTCHINPASFGTPEEQVYDAFGGHAIAFADLFVGGSFNPRRDTSQTSDPFLVSIGLTLGETQPAEPRRVLVVEAPPNMLANRKVLLSLTVVAIGGLATAGLVWRRRKRSLYRTPGGRRPIAPYRSTGVPYPHGTISSRPP